MKPNPVEVGRRIKSLRLSKGLTMEEFGKLFENVSRGVISNWEKGYHIPNNARLKMIAEYARIPVDELLYGKKYRLTDFETEELLDEIKRRL